MKKRRTLTFFSISIVLLALGASFFSPVEGPRPILNEEGDVIKKHEPAAQFEMDAFERIKADWPAYSCLVLGFAFLACATARGLTTEFKAFRSRFSLKPLIRLIRGTHRRRRSRRSSARSNSTAMPMGHSTGASSASNPARREQSHLERPSAPP